MNRKEKTKKFVEIIKKQCITTELEALLEDKENDELRTREEIQIELERLLENKTEEEVLIFLIDNMTDEKFKYYETCFEN